MPFWSFFLATFIGKALIKVNGQACFFITVFTEQYLASLVSWIDRIIPNSMDPCRTFVRKECHIVIRDMLHSAREKFYAQSSPGADRSGEGDGSYMKTAWNTFILIVILPNSAGPIRNTVKHWGDVRYGVMTQCLRYEKFMAANNQYWNNVALKINARLGGCNSSSESDVLTVLKREPYMVVGADVGHPGPGVAKPSVTGLVFSYDPGATKYAALTEIQQPRVEIIESLQKMMEIALKRFKDVAKVLPKRVIFFRDGVSEGEYNTVATSELAAIQDAIKTLSGDNQILVTFIVVGKRHHSVFFPRNNEGDKKGNCHPGLVVDNEVTGPMRNDFYLQSHAAIQGTPRSAHYIVLHDKIFGGDMQRIQELAFTLCHVYAKATRSVSIPAPVYYADLVCSRGVFHMSPEAHNLQFDDSASSASGGSSFDLNMWRSAFKGINKYMGKKMYFL